MIVEPAYTVTAEHAGAAWARSPWEAVQRAARDALHKLSLRRAIGLRRTNHRSER